MNFWKDIGNQFCTLDLNNAIFAGCKMIVKWIAVVYKIQNISFAKVITYVNYILYIFSVNLYMIDLNVV